MKHFFRISNTTLILILITTIVFFFQQITFLFDTSAYSIYYAGGILGIKFTLSEWYRLITPIFVHIGITHFVVNMITLHYTGPVIDRLYGSAKFVLIYLICGICGNIAAAVFNPLSVSAGASTSLFGLFAILAMNGMYHKDPMVSIVGKNYMSVIAFNLILNLMQPNVSLAGHIGGLIGGVICYYCFKTKY